MDQSAEAKSRQSRCGSRVLPDWGSTADGGCFSSIDVAMNTECLEECTEAAAESERDNALI